jgi:hypothetical protein
LLFALPTVLLALLLLLALIAGAAGCGLLVGRSHAAESRPCVAAWPPHSIARTDDVHPWWVMPCSAPNG